jgi:hypothetical protein
MSVMANDFVLSMCLGMFVLVLADTVCSLPIASWAIINDVGHSEYHGEDKVTHSF